MEKRGFLSIERRTRETGTQRFASSTIDKKMKRPISDAR